ncbi:hypothetical protein ACIOEZ_06985 [Streptomyces sp. NPDC087866]|uniref:hypothetical protein n=1 Tax=unclassified Streptomyces TaxID=2593676 RepID=UPI0022510A25|nr:hypothetical protein [Streptomyces sp. NBC_01789]MCX4444855.1 hypothetical protein [Streptomyces sp. NBC_01789]
MRTVHRPAHDRRRRVTIRGQIVGLAHDDANVVEFLRHAGLPEAEQLLDDSSWVQWHGGRAHRYEAS